MLLINIDFRRQTRISNLRGRHLGENRASCKVCPALGLMQFVISGRKKARQLVTNLVPKQALRLIQPSFAKVNWMKAILGAAWVVPVLRKDDMVMERWYYQAGYKLIDL